MTDEYMDKLPVIPGTSIKEIKERLQPFVDAGVTRLVVPYVPVDEPVIDDARRFVEALGKFVKICESYRLQPIGAAVATRRFGGQM